MATLSNLLSVVTSAATIGLTYFNLRRLYGKWSQLQDDPQASTAEKTQVIVDSAMNATALVGNVASLVSIGYEIGYQARKAEMDQIQKEWIAECKETSRNGVYCDHNWGGAQKAYLGIEKNLLNYQRANFVLTCSNTVLLASQVGTHLMNHGVNEERIVLTKILLRGGSVVYASHLRANCGRSIETDKKNNLSVQLINLTMTGVDLKDEYDLFLKELEHVPMTIDRKVYTPYQLPASPNDESLKYSLIPDGFHDERFFERNICRFSQAPIAQPLFVIVDKNFPRIYEKQQLVKYMFMRKEEGRPYRIPETNQIFTENQVYECLALTVQFKDVLIQLQQEQLERLSAQLQAVRV